MKFNRTLPSLDMPAWVVQKTERWKARSHAAQLIPNMQQGLYALTCKLKPRKAPQVYRFPIIGWIIDETANGCPLPVTTSPSLNAAILEDYDVNFVVGHMAQGQTECGLVTTAFGNFPSEHAWIRDCRELAKFLEGFENEIRDLSLDQQVEEAKTC